MLLEALWKCHLQGARGTSRRGPTAAVHLMVIENLLESKPSENEKINRKDQHNGRKCYEMDRPAG